VVIKSKIEGAHQLTADLATEHAKTCFVDYGQLTTYLVAMRGPGAWEEMITGKNYLGSGQAEDP
jgi:hypothetical protein